MPQLLLFRKISIYKKHAGYFKTSKNTWFVTIFSSFTFALCRRSVHLVYDRLHNFSS